ncbi:Uncharacterised protein [Klebsiella pneumoniae]|nr:Uncharacterised protein [Klebsiella pneumoniae]
MREKKINPLSLLIAKTTTKLVKEDSIKNGSYTFLNFYSYFIYRKQPSNYTFFKHIYCDGILLQKMPKFVGRQLSTPEL